MFGQKNISGEKFSTSAQEISHISTEAQKRYILQERPGTTPEEAATEAISRYATAQAEDFLHESRVLPAHEAERIVLKLKPEAHDEQIETLFGIMLSKGIKNALDIASKSGNAHLEDDFHRFLVQYLHTIGAIPGLKNESSLAHELGHRLFMIALPPLTDTKTEASEFKRFIQAMKQLYSGMTTASDWNSGEYYTLELAVQHSGRDIALYASIPGLHIDTFEKLVRAYYPT